MDGKALSKQLPELSNDRASARHLEHALNTVYDATIKRIFMRILYK